MRRKARVRIGFVLASAVLIMFNGLGGTGAGAAGSAPESGRQKPGGESRLSQRLHLLSTPDLLGASTAARAGRLSLPVQGPGSLIRRAGVDEVLVDVRVDTAGTAQRDAVGKAGLTVTHMSPRYGVITGWVSPARLQALAQATGVRSVQEVLAPMVGQTAPASENTTAAVTPAVCAPTISEGDNQLKAAQARFAFGVDGTNVKVGVLSDSFDRATSTSVHAANDVASGDLPGAGNPCGRTTPVQVVSDPPGTGLIDEGRAMSQIVHDLAPGAKLAFATAFGGVTSFADNIRSLRNTHGSSVIVDDITYFVEPMFQDGPVSVAVNDVVGAGAAYFSSAGNSNTIVGGKNISSYEAPAYRPATCPPGLPGFAGPTCHDFNPAAGVDTTGGYTLVNNGSLLVDLQWAEPWDGVSTDLDVYLMNSATNTILASSTGVNTTSQRPFEFISYQNTTGASQNVHLVINRFAGGAPRLKYVFFRSNVSSAEHNTSSGGDVIGPTIIGHNGAGKANSVAAVPFNNSAIPESFTSRGPVTLYFGPVSGTTPAPPLPSPLVLNKPDFAATDGGLNTFFPPPCSPCRFFGTSASAPHAAAVAALMRHRSPNQSPASVTATLKATAVPVPNGGTAAAVGSGLVDAQAAVGASPFLFNANPAATSTSIALDKAVNLTASKNAGCSANYGPACATPQTVSVSTSNFAGKPNAPVTVALCNSHVAFSANLNGTGAQGDIAHGCDFGNARGYAGQGVPNSGNLQLNASGNCCVSGSTVTLQLPSAALLTQWGGPSGANTNANAVCPPTAAQIAAGRTCAVVLGELNAAAPFAPWRYAGYRQAFLKSPIPSITCNGGTCPSSIPTGTSVAVTGVQFPCRTIQPDDPATIGYDGACLQAHTNKTILLKRVATGQLVPGAITPTSQTANVNGNYTVTFTMPAVPAGSELYKIIPHAQSCSFPCESGNFNAAGKLFRHA